MTDVAANRLSRAEDKAPRGGVATRSSPARQRKLHLGHFAFMRAVVQGLDTRDSWDRYLRLEGEHGDSRNVRRVIQWIRDEFAAAAKRHDRYGTARLVQIDAARVAAGEAVLPSLEEFAAEHGLQEFSEADQLEQYRAHYGNQSGRQGRRTRLIARQLEALSWLERLVAQPPQAGDSIASWLNPDLVVHLEAAGVNTVRNLVDRINGLGMRWWNGIPAIGEVKAARIMDWLHAHEGYIGLTVGAHAHARPSTLSRQALACIVPPETGIVPIEKFVVPPELDGSKGLYRAPQRLCLMGATNDYEAVLDWVRSKQGIAPERKAMLKGQRGVNSTEPEGPLAWLQYLSHTQRAYLKEAERFLLWAILQRRKPLSSMTLEDCEAYRSFLADPTPSERWCGPRDRKKWSPLWRPFEGQLSPRAQRHAITILKSFYKFLVDHCYLIGNPWNGVALPKLPGARINRGRSFTEEQWRFIEQHAARLAETSTNRRLRFALRFFYATGLRLSEGTAATVDHLNWVSYPPAHDDHELVEGWELTVVGKGSKERVVPVPLEVISDLAHYLAARGLDPDPENPENRGAFLLGRAADIAERAPWLPQASEAIDAKAGISAGTLYAQMKGFFKSAAQGLAATDLKGAERLAAASTHWLRHTHGSHSVAAGVPLDVLQQNLGHASLDTTTVYTTSEGRRRMKAVREAWKSLGRVKAN